MNANNAHALIEIKGAAVLAAAKIVGRFIDQVARGYDQDPVLVDELCVYKAIQVAYPNDTIPLPTMFKTMIKRASKEPVEGYNDSLEGLSDEAKALWNSDNDISEHDALMAAMPRITELYMEAEPDIERWDDIPTIAQWSLLCKVEADLSGKIDLYKSWANRDRAAGKTGTNAMRLQAEAEAAVEPLHELVSEFLADEGVQEDLQNAAENGTNVPERVAA